MVNATVVVTPWQHFSDTARALENLFAFTPFPFELIYIDGNSPKRVRDYLRAEANKRGFKLIRTERYLTWSEARNLALPHVKTRYAMFLDNGTLVTPGWLPALIRSAEETGAWAVEPIYCFGDMRMPTIYSFAPQLDILEDGAGRHVVETAPLFRTPLADARAKLTRTSCGYAKFHCALIRMDAIERLGAFDEGYTSYHDHRDFGLAIRLAGGTVYAEPDSVVMLIDSPRLRWSDLPLFLLRWSNAWLLPSVHHFARVWNVDVNDDGLQGGTRFRNVQRRKLFSGLHIVANRCGGWRAASAVDKVIDAVFDYVIEPLIVARLERRRLQMQRDE